MYFAALTSGSSCIAVAAVAALCQKVDVKVKTNISQQKQPVVNVKEVKNARNTERFSGNMTVLRVLARLHDESSQDLKLYGNNPVDSTKIDFFLDLANGPATVKSGLDIVSEQLNEHLALRTYLVGPRITLADLALWEALNGNPRWPSLQKSKKYKNLARWFVFLSKSEPTIRERTTKTQTKRSEGGKFIALKGDTSKVCTRFPPEPSGYMHIGHCKAALLNNYFAQHYKGRLILRFDDTNPAKEKDEFVQNIIKDLATLKVKYHVVTHTSDHFELIQQKATWMIEQGKAYIDDTPVDKMREQRFEGIASAARSNSVAKNLELWNEMLRGTEKGVQCCLRLKIDMQNPNKCLRDPVGYRCNPTPHHRTGSKYKAYPTYDFACPIVDSIEGVSHTLRTSEYSQRDAQYYWVIDALGIRKPLIWSYSRMNFVKTVLSKRKLAWFVENKMVDGWNDPRFPTVQGILRRGMQVEALKEFILSQGASKSDNLMGWDKIWSINKKHIDPKAARYTAISNSRVEIKITNFDTNTNTQTSLPLHPKNPKLGRTPFLMTPTIVIEKADAKFIKKGEEVTLMGWGNIIITDIQEDLNMVAKLHLEGNVKKTKTKLTWLPVPSAADEAKHGPVDVTFVNFGYLITVDKLQEGQDFKDVINPNSRTEFKGTGLKAMENLKAGEIIQVQRRGFFRVDSTNPLVLFDIPTGKQRGMSVLT